MNLTLTTKEQSMSTRVKEEVLFRAPQHVFVYGSLKKGFGNHHILSDKASAFYCGHYLTKVASFEMRSYGGFPAITNTLKNGKKISGELYLCTPETIERLDSLEGHPHWYKRKRILMDDGTWAFTYILPEEHTTDLPLVELTNIDGDEAYRWEKGVYDVTNI